MQELSHATKRRFHDSRFATRWFVGDAIDIGAGNDSLAHLAMFFPLLRSVVGTDIQDGDAMLMDWVPDESYDVVHSSHCWEHCRDPKTTLTNWIRICRKGGHLVILIPDEDLYEQGVWPSTFNDDHKFTFTIGKSQSWSPVSVSLIHFLQLFTDQVRILKIELLDHGFVYNAQRIDQTLGVMSESAIELVLQKL